ncbi:MAG: hypothetical protein GF308_20820 [Candidatus Heimdallarchaeota archaeon]|nr:hypothetical protein [Candidatus Heimdallarchaeota archaeon]
MIKKILGFGAVLWDLSVNVDYSFLKKLNIKKSSYAEIDFQTINELLNLVESAGASVIENPGGSCANVMSNLAKLGSSASFCGRHGDDVAGRRFMNILKKDGVQTRSILDYQKSTGMVFSFITPDKDRTFRTYIGASDILPAESIDESMVKKADNIHIEGYLMSNSVEALWKIFEVGDKISFDLAAESLILKRRTELQKLMTAHPAFILSANIHEGRAFTQKEELEDVIDRMLDFSEIAVVTLGEKGAYGTTKNGELHFQPAIHTIPADTTGAGDSFCAGFLHDFLKSGDIKKGMETGTQTASLTISKIGARSLERKQLKHFIKES